MIQIYTPSSALLERMQKLLPELYVANGIFDINKDNVVITDVNSASKLLSERPELKVLALSDTPNFEEGQGLLQKGLKGYANTYIHLLHLNQALDFINTGNIWLYPSFMQELIDSTKKKVPKEEVILELLTAREKETALQVANGKSNKEIAQALNITERTVKSHLSSIFEKTKTGDRMSLALKIKG